MPVVDASLLVSAVADTGPAGRWAESVIVAGDLVAPHLVFVEAAHALRRLESAALLGRLESTAAHADLTRLDLQLVPYEPFAERVWELRANLSSYDAWYVAVAELARLPLATLDRRLARSAGPECDFLLPPDER
ncbi:MAG: type II toxin-antitoxin system VapC family toxin [Acidobacteriota bacterium]|jgi:predicted nucleic acid-binding protein